MYAERLAFETGMFEDELMRADNPLRVEGHLPRPEAGAATLEDASF